MNDRQFEYIQMVAREKSISAAAKKLMISQPSLSQFIKKVEDDLGTALFVRSAPLKLTYAGECFLKTSERIMQEERLLQEKLSLICGGDAGRITIGSGFVNSVILLPVMIRKFTASHPGVSFTVTECVESELKNAVDQNQIDAAVSTSPIEDSSFSIHTLLKEDYLVAVPKQYERWLHTDADGFLDPMQLSDIPFVANENSTLIGHVFSEMLSRSDISPEIVVTCTSTESAYAMTRCGIGASVIPESIYWFSRSSDVGYYHVKGNEFKRKVFFYYKKDMERYNLFKLFVDESLALFKEEMDHI